MTLFYPLLLSINIIELSRCHVFPVSDCVISTAYGNTIHHFHTLLKIPGYKFPLLSSFSGFFLVFFFVLVFLLSEGTGSRVLPFVFLLSEDCPWRGSCCCFQVHTSACSLNSCQSPSQCEFLWLLENDSTRLSPGTKHKPQSWTCWIWSFLRAPFPKNTQPLMSHPSKCLTILCSGVYYWVLWACMPP